MSTSDASCQTEDFDLSGIEMLLSGRFDEWKLKRNIPLHHDPNTCMDECCRYRLELNVPLKDVNSFWGVEKKKTWGKKKKEIDFAP